MEFARFIAYPENYQEKSVVDNIGPCLIDCNGKSFGNIFSINL
jgi:hypothetical protein